MRLTSPFNNIMIVYDYGEVRRNHVLHCHLVCLTSVVKSRVDVCSNSLLSFFPVAESSISQPVDLEGLAEAQSGAAPTAEG